MFRDFVMNRWVFGGVGFLIMLAIGCVFWYQHDTAPDRKDAAETQKIVQQLKPLPKKDTKILLFSPSMTIRMMM